jgi:von Willebrand factor type A domain/Putative Flp pilus-assembly TadE/G-like
MTKFWKQKAGQRGTALIVGTCSMVLLVPTIGLAVDIGILYSLKAHLQASVDGASLAAARALSLSANTASQVTDAQQNATNWFYANFPNTYWNATSTDMAADDTHVHVYDDPVNPHLRHVDVTAAVDAPNFFMRWFGSATTHIAAKGFASRRDIVAMLVLDRSGSMGGQCPNLIEAAKLFTGQFSQGRDKIGAISFADNAYLHSVPTDQFRAALGFETAVGATGSNTGTGELDTIACSGGTNSASAIALAYNELYKTAEPGALNVIVFETDGHPNTLTMNFADINTITNTVVGVGLSGTSGCTDRGSPAKTKAGGGYLTVASIPTWQGTYSPSVPAYTTTTLANGSTTWPNYSAVQPGPAFLTTNIPAGMIGALGGTDSGPSTYLMFRSFTNTKANTYGEGSAATQYLQAATAPGCLFASANTFSGNSTELSWIPTKDVYGNNLVNATYQTVTTANLDGGTRVSPVNITQMQNASINAVDDAARRFRNNATIPATFYAIGFNNGVDYAIMQRVANDPGWINDATHCPASAKCLYTSTEPVGKFYFAPTTTALNNAFQSIASQILRLAQ